MAANLKGINVRTLTTAHRRGGARQPDGFVRDPPTVWLPFHVWHSAHEFAAPRLRLGLSASFSRSYHVDSEVTQRDERRNESQHLPDGTHFVPIYDTPRFDPSPRQA